MIRLILIFLSLLLFSCTTTNNSTISSKEYNTISVDDFYTKINECKKSNGLVDIDCIKNTFSGKENIISKEINYEDFILSIEEMNKCNYFSTTGESSLYSKCLKEIYIKYPPNRILNLGLCGSYLIDREYDLTISCVDNFYPTEENYAYMALKGSAYILKGEIEKGLGICKTELEKYPYSYTLKKCVELGKQ